MLRNDSNDYLTQMPSEMLVAVFRYLSLRDILTLFLVNNKIKVIAKDNFIWRVFVEQIAGHGQAQLNQGSKIITGKNNNALPRPIKRRKVVDQEMMMDERPNFFADYRRQVCQKKYGHHSAWITGIFYVIDRNLHENILKTIEDELTMKADSECVLRISELLSVYNKNGDTIPVLLTRKLHGQEFLDSIYKLICNYLSSEYHFHCAITLHQVTILKKYLNHLNINTQDCIKRVNDAVHFKENKELDDEYYNKQSDIFWMQPLQVAALHNNNFAIKILLEKGAQTQPGGDGWDFEYTALHRAVEHGHFEVVRRLVEKDLNSIHALSTETFENENIKLEVQKPIELAIITNRFKIFEFLYLKMKIYADFIVLNSYLELAIVTDSVDIFKFLYPIIGDSNNLDSYLTIASKYNSVGISKFLYTNLDEVEGDEITHSNTNSSITPKNTSLF